MPTPINRKLKPGPTLATVDMWCHDHYGLYVEACLICGEAHFLVPGPWQRETRICPETGEWRTYLCTTYRIHYWARRSWTRRAHKPNFWEVPKP